MRIINPISGIQLTNLSFSYGETEVLHGLSLDIKEGQNIGIVGESGGGKSTLLKLLSGLYRIQSGFLCVAGEQESEQIQKKVSMVMQEAMLFPVSIRDNITCGHPIASDRLREACEASQLTAWLGTLPNGIDTFVGERGGKVSGGQAQRIAIARAIVKNAPVILLDEATSALDSKTGELLIHAVNHLTKGKTVINVSHRREALIGCDCIYRLTGGKLCKY